MRVPITAAVGAEYRVEKGTNIAAVPAGTPDYVRTDYLIQYGESFAGKVDVTEGYVETFFPFLRDAPGAKRLDLDLAARISEYKNKGGFGTTGEERTHDMTTWKAQRELGTARLAALPRHAVARQPCGELPRALLRAEDRSGRPVRVLRSARRPIRATSASRATWI